MESKKRAMDESGVSSGSQATVANDLPTSRRHSATPGTTSGTFSTSHTQAAQWTPSR